LKKKDKKRFSRECQGLAKKEKRNQTMVTYVINTRIKTNRKLMAIQPNTTPIGAIMGVGSLQPCSP
jgi:hypothetical protein